MTLDKDSFIVKHSSGRVCIVHNALAWLHRGKGEVATRGGNCGTWRYVYPELGVKKVFYHD